MRRRQFIHIVDFAVRSAPPVKRYPVPRGDPLFGVGRQRRIGRRSRTGAFRSFRRNRPRRFCPRIAARPGLLGASALSVVSAALTCGGSGRSADVRREAQLQKQMQRAHKAHGTWR